MRIEGIWYPEPLRQHDCPIMELIVHKLSRSELRDINAVRMFLQVSMLSEIITTNGKLIGITHQSGFPPFLQQANSLPNWPRQPNPSPRAWSRWRRVIRTISHGRKLKEPLGPWLLPAPTTWKFFTSNEIPHHLLQRSGSQWLAHKQISGRHWALHRRDGRHVLPPLNPQPAQVSINAHYIVTEGLNHSPPTPRTFPTSSSWADHLKDHTQTTHEWDLHYELESSDQNLCLATDEGASRGRGYFGWVIVTPHSHLWQGSGILPTLSSQLNSLRPESMSYLAALEFLRAYTDQHRTSIRCNINHISDNSTLIRRLHRYNSQQSDSPSSITRSDMDVQLQIEASLEELHSSQHISITSEHIKSHQDSKIGPLTWKASLNVTADHLADTASHLPKPRDIPLPASGVSIWESEQQVTRNIKQHIIQCWSTRKYFDYLRTKYSWSQHHISTIDFTSSPHNDLSLSERIFLASFSHQWLPLQVTLHKRKNVPLPLFALCALELRKRICTSHSVEATRQTQHPPYATR